MNAEDLNRGGVKSFLAGFVYLSIFMFRWH